MGATVHTRSIVLAAVLALAAGCGSDDGGTARDDGLTIVATTTVLGDVVESIVGEHAAVEVLLPVGADPHAYQPSSEQVAAMETAELVVANGLGLEEGLVDVIEAIEADGAEVVEIGPLVDPIPFTGGHDHVAGSCDPMAGHDHEETDPEATPACDPHVWMDPLRMADAAAAIAGELAALDPGVDWSARADEYAGSLRDLDEEIRETMAGIPPERRVIVTNHDSLGYFAARYDLEVVGTVIPGGSTMAEPSSADLSELVETMEAEGVRVLFVETTNPDALGGAVAEELGAAVEVVELYTGSLGAPGSGAATYEQMLRTDARLIAEVLD